MKGPRRERQGSRTIPALRHWLLAAAIVGGMFILGPLGTAIVHA